MTIDSNIIIAYLDGERIAVDILSQWRREGKPLFLSAVVEAEVLSFSKWTESERLIVENFLEENFALIPFDRSAARIAAKIRRTLKVRLPDAAIAATALLTHTPLATRNQKDFKKIAGLDLFVL